MYQSYDHRIILFLIIITLIWKVHQPPLYLFTCSFFSHQVNGAFKQRYKFADDANVRKKVETEEYDSEPSQKI